MDLSNMVMKTGVDYELRTLLKTELETLMKYVKMFNDMTDVEKDSLREWMAHGRSVNSNGNYLYGENGCLLDFITAEREEAEMRAHPEPFFYTDFEDGEGFNFDEEPFL